MGKIKVTFSLWEILTDNLIHLFFIFYLVGEEKMKKRKKKKVKRREKN